MLYAIVDKDGKVARHRSKGTLAVYQDTTYLKNMVGGIWKIIKSIE